MKKILLSLSINVDRKIRWIFAFVLILMIFFVSFLFRQKQKQASTHKWVDLTYQTIRKTDSIGMIFAEAESAASLYMITGDNEQKAQVNLLYGQLNQCINELGLLSAENSLLQYQIRKLRQLVLEKASSHQKMLALKTKSFDPSKNLQQFEKGNETSRTIRILLNSIREIEKEMLTNRVLEHESSNSVSTNTSLLGSLLTFLLVMAILVQLNRDILLRKKAEEEIRIRQEKYRSLTENAGVVMYTTDHKGQITFANNQVTHLTGYSAEELNGKHFSILLDPGSKEKIIKYYQSQYEKKIAVTHQEFLCLTKSGSFKWVEQSAQLLFEDTHVTGFQCMVRDISEKKLAEKELILSETKRKENEYRLNAILDNSTALIYIKDLEGRYVMANHKFRELLKLSDSALIGHTDFDISPKELAEHYQLTDKEVLSTRKPIETEEIVETPSGKRNLLLLKFPLLTPEQELIGVSGIATDVTEKVELQKQHLEALHKAESAQQVQEQFLANMSHEIRTPMNGIQGMTRLMMETALSEEQKNFANIISRSLNNLVVIVNNVLDYSNLRTGKLVLDNYAFNLIEILEDVKKHFEHSLKNKQLPFQLHIAKNVPYLIKGDAHRLKQVLTNLVGNAIKFTEKGEINLAVSVRKLSENQMEILFELTDTGIGIPKEKQETVFESFAQAGKKISSDYGGAGLGLTISKGLIELQGGYIGITSEQGKGSVFTFMIPFGLTEKNDIVASQSDYAEKLAGKRVLVVEDNQVNQKLIDFVLKKVSVKADLAVHGKEAIALCEKNPPYDLIIMDLQMPVMDGYETTIYLRQTMKLTTPIIAMTATALKQDQEKCAQVGMNDFMIKPFDFNDLYNRMTRLLFKDVYLVPKNKEEKIEKNKPFSFSVLEELDDKKYLIEVVSLFLNNIPNDIRELMVLGENNDWDNLYKKAHKIKSAAGLLKALELSTLLGEIETNAKNRTNIDSIPSEIQKASALFSEMEKAIQNELTLIEKDLAAAG